jgi:hypothetical protein
MFSLMQIYFLISEAQRFAAAAEGLDLHAKHACIERAAFFDACHGQYKMVEMVDLDHGFILPLKLNRRSLVIWW